MSFPRNSLRLALAAALLASAGAAAADILVVRSIGPSARSFPPGKRLPDSARVTLQAADQITILDARGTRTLRGPGTFAGGAASRQVASAPPVDPQRRARIGAVRGVEAGPLRPPSLRHIDIAKSANFCVAPGAALTLWRADTDRALPLSITRASDGAARQVRFDAGASTFPWPSDFAATEGARYRLSRPGAGRPADLVFRTMPGAGSGLQDMAAALIARGCDAQLDLLIETVRLPDTAPRG